MAVAIVAFGVLNFLTPLYHDDFVYQFMFEGGTVNYDNPIKSISDIVASQVEHYHSVNGRSIVHFLVQLFTGLLGKTVFNLFNIIVFGVFLFLLRDFSSSRKRETTPNQGFTAVILVLVLLLPRFKDTFLWMTGSINYLWSATAALLFPCSVGPTRASPYPSPPRWFSSTCSRSDRATAMNRDYGWH